MKRYILYIFSALCLCASCDKGGGKAGTIEPVTGAECSPFIGSVLMKWTDPASENYYYTLVSYVNAAGETVNRKVSRYSAWEDNVTEVLITGFTDTDEHEFILVAYGFDGSSSIPVRLKGRADGISGAADYVMESVVMKATDAGALLEWTNETSVGVALHVSYINGLGITVEEEVDASATGEFSFNDLVLGSTEFTVFAENAADGYRTASRKITVESIVDPRDIIKMWYDPERTTDVNFDHGTVGVDVEVVEEYSYRLTMDVDAAERYIVFEPLGKNIRRNDLVVTFQYKCTDSFDLTFMYYPFEWETIAQNYRNKGTLAPSEEWKTVSFSITDDIATLPGRWGTSTSQIRFIFSTGHLAASSGKIDFEIKSIEIRPGK